MAILELVTLIHWYQNYCNVIAKNFGLLRKQTLKILQFVTPKIEADIQIYNPQIYYFIFYSRTNQIIGATYWKKTDIVIFSFYCNMLKIQ